MSYYLRHFHSLPGQSCQATATGISVQEESERVHLIATDYVAPPTASGAAQLIAASRSRLAGKRRSHARGNQREAGDGPSGSKPPDGVIVGNSPLCSSYSAGVTPLLSVLPALSESRSELCEFALTHLLSTLEQFPTGSLCAESPEQLHHLLSTLVSLRLTGSTRHIRTRSTKCLLALILAVGRADNWLAGVEALLLGGSAVERREHTPARRPVNLPQDPREEGSRTQLPLNFHRLALAMQGETTTSWDLKRDPLCIFHMEQSATNSSSDDEEGSALRGGLSGGGGCLVADGLHLYLLTHFGLTKFGSGLGETRCGEVLAHNSLLKWLSGSSLLLCNNSLYLRRQRSSRLWVLDVETLREVGEIILPPSLTSAGVLFSDAASKTFYRGVISPATVNMRQAGCLELTTLDDSFEPNKQEGVGEERRWPPIKLIESILKHHGGGDNARRQALIQSLPREVMSRLAEVEWAHQGVFLLTKRGSLHYAAMGEADGARIMDIPIADPVIEIASSAPDRLLLLRSGPGRLWACDLSSPPPFNPQRVRAPNNDRCLALATSAGGGCFAYITASDGRIHLHGKHPVQQLPNLYFSSLPPMVSIALGRSHVAAVDRNGHLYAGGMNQSGQCGRARKKAESGETMALPFLETLQRVPLPDGVTAATVSAGHWHTIVLCTDYHTVYTFGYVRRPTPHRVETPQGVQVVQAVAGTHHCVLRTKCGRVLTFDSRRNGDNDDVEFIKPSALSGYGPSGDCGLAVWVGADADSTLVISQKPFLTDSQLAEECQLSMANDTLIVAHVASGTIYHIDRHKAAAGDLDPVTRIPLSSTLDRLPISLDPAHPQLLWTLHPFSGSIHCNYSSTATTSNPLLSIEMLVANDTELCCYSDEHLAALLLHLFQLQLGGKGIPVWAVRVGAGISCSAETASGGFKRPGGGHGPLLIAKRFRTIGSRGCCWSYALAHSVEAIQFQTSRDVLLHGVGLYGSGRGEKHKARLKIYRLLSGGNGGAVGVRDGDEEDEEERSVELVGGTEEMFYGCPSGETALIRTSHPHLITAGQWYIVVVQVAGPDSEYGSGGQPGVVVKLGGDGAGIGRRPSTAMATASAVEFKFSSSILSNNGTDVELGQIPEFYFRLPEEQSSMGVRPRPKGTPSASLAALNPPSAEDAEISLPHLLRVIYWALGRLEKRHVANKGSVVVELWQLERIVFICITALRIMIKMLTASAVEVSGGKVSNELNALFQCAFNIGAGVSSVDGHASDGSHNAVQLLMSELVKVFSALFPVLSSDRAVVRSWWERVLVDEGVKNSWFTVALLEGLCELDAHTLVAALARQSGNAEECSSLDGRTVTALLRLALPGTRSNNPAKRHELEERMRLGGQKLVTHLAEGLLGLVVDDGGKHFRRRSSQPAAIPTPSRFRRTSTTPGWKVSSDDRHGWDAVGFTFTLAGTQESSLGLHGIGIYLDPVASANGNHYLMELWRNDDVEGVSDERWERALGESCGVKIIEQEGSFAGTGHLSFSRPSIIEPGVAYAVRVRVCTPAPGLNGDSDKATQTTLYGEEGMSTVDLDDGDTPLRIDFFTTPSSLSPNGTTRSRGQIPYLIYSSLRPDEYQQRPTPTPYSACFISLMRTLAQHLCHRIANSREEETAGLDRHEHDFATGIISCANRLVEIAPEASYNLLLAVDELMPLLSRASTGSDIRHDKDSRRIAMVEWDAGVESGSSHFSALQAKLIEFPPPQTESFLAVSTTSPFETDSAIWAHECHTWHEATSNYHLPGARVMPGRWLLLRGNRVLLMKENGGGDERERTSPMNCIVEALTEAERTSDEELEQKFAWLCANACRQMVKYLRRREEESPTNTTFSKLGDEYRQLLGRGMDWARPPMLASVLHGKWPELAESRDRTLLNQFVAADRDSVAGRIAKIVAEEPFVDVDNCWLSAESCRPTANTTFRIGQRIRLRLHVVDQYGTEMSTDPRMDVEVTIAAKGDSRQRSGAASGWMPALRDLQLSHPYQPLLTKFARYVSITATPLFGRWSLEELRLGFTQIVPASHVREVRVRLNCAGDGKEFSVEWTPPRDFPPGVCMVKGRVDGLQLANTLEIGIEAGDEQEAEEVLGEGLFPLTSPYKSLRLRCRPSLCGDDNVVAELKRNSLVDYTQVVRNGDGVWLRLSAESVKEHAPRLIREGGRASLWCLQSHSHLGVDLMRIVDGSLEEGEESEEASDSESHHHHSVDLVRERRRTPFAPRPALIDCCRWVMAARLWHTEDSSSTVKAVLGGSSSLMRAQHLWRDCHLFVDSVLAVVDGASRSGEKLTQIKDRAKLLLELRRPTNTPRRGWNVNLFPSLPPLMPSMRSDPASDEVMQWESADTPHIYRSDPGHHHQEPSSPHPHTLLSTSARMGGSEPTSSESRSSRDAIFSFLADPRVEPSEVRHAIEQSTTVALALSHSLQQWNWLLRLVSNESVVADILWHYLTAVANGHHGQSSHFCSLPSPAELCPLASEELRRRVASHFHSLLSTVALILLSSPTSAPSGLHSDGAGWRLHRLCFEVWKFRLDSRFDQPILPTLRKLLSIADAILAAGQTEEVSTGSEFVTDLLNITSRVELQASTNTPLLAYLADPRSDTFWESGQGGGWIYVVLTPELHLGSAALLGLYIDNARDDNYRIDHLRVSSVQETEGEGRGRACCLLFEKRLERRFAGWVRCPLPLATNTIKIEMTGEGRQEVGCRLTRLILLAQSPLNEQHSGTGSKGASHTYSSISQLSALDFIQHAVEGEFNNEENVSHPSLPALRQFVSDLVLDRLSREVDALREGMKNDFSYLTHTISLLKRLTAANSRAPAEHLQPRNATALVLLSDTLLFAPRAVQQRAIEVMTTMLKSLEPVGPSEDVCSRLVQNISVAVAKVLTVRLKAGITGDRCHQPAFNFEAQAMDTSHGWKLNERLKLSDVKRLITTTTNACSVDRIEGGSEMREAIVRQLLSFCKLIGPLLGGVGMGLAASSKEASTLERCLCFPQFWLAIASLSLLPNTAWLEASREWKRAVALSYSHGPESLCDNHEDGETAAHVHCVECGMDLCGDCYNVLHMSRRWRDHQRRGLQCCSSLRNHPTLRVTVHVGCSRFEMGGISILLNRDNLSALVSQQTALGDEGIGRAGAGAGIGMSQHRSMMPGEEGCRFCGQPAVTSSSPPVCSNNEECTKREQWACLTRLPCDHWCGGIRQDESSHNHPPCLHCPASASGADGGGEQDASDLCAICFVERLADAPCVQLRCGHLFHYHCIRSVLERRWAGPRITFRFIQCPLCKQQVSHPALSSLLAPLLELHADVSRKALMRLEYDGLLERAAALTSPSSTFYRDPVGYAMERYMYCLCASCGRAYFGGESRCQEEAAQTSSPFLSISLNFNPDELICGQCCLQGSSPTNSNAQPQLICARHGTEFLEYKCRYCCSVAVYFCFGTTHFCAGCHADFRRLLATPKHALPRCPVGPGARQLTSTYGPSLTSSPATSSLTKSNNEGDGRSGMATTFTKGWKCPLKLASHPPTGEEFSLGCGVCRNLLTF